MGGPIVAIVSQGTFTINSGPLVLPLIAPPAAPSFDPERVITICQDLGNKLRKVGEFEGNADLEQLLIMAADINKRLEFMSREINIGTIELNERLNNIDT